MDTIRINRKHVKMIAHRGVSGLERENTCPAFVAAGNRSYFGIETDIHVTADGQFVVIHDETTTRVTLGKTEINVETQPYSAVADLILPDLDGSLHRSDIRIPLLAEYIAICKKYNKKAVLELKNPMAQAHIVRLVEQLQEIDYLENMIFISFSMENCVALRALLPHAHIQWLTAQPIDEEIIAQLVAHRLDLDILYQRLNAELVKKLHRRNIIVNCWTCDDPQEADKLIEMGVDMITTNILE